MAFGLAGIETEEDTDGVTPAALWLLETIEYVRVLVAGVMTFVASTHVCEEVWRVFRPLPISCHGPGDSGNPPSAVQCC
ncbi:hypothetical protein [Corynebacterium ulcerans]|uniref:Uncharacterized protein n=1 Tax=Corynebacterium ulcerans TaxID=65058 RepID=A0ABD0BGI2_CORUL|nr:hypothetical protein [Corynebacterium ulcerans]KPH74781.1 hypothetical protein AFK72_07905 [Corynebacterium ulcerans]MBH5297979.1 hypothetical protein [Corynebacterium ulcerans]MBL4943269.1 hypothetical protein [Corynebacterium ulcerans]NOL57282.1 hypothetical protein [Corynebacterium ulcerans]NOM01608.1 hypothetical protein [Corynebacterium ulcerans]